MEKFEELVNKDEYQVFIFYCPAYFPFNYFRHPWFVLNKKGEISRWEIRHIRKNSSYLYVNNQPPFEGISKTIFLNIYWKAILLGNINGDIAQRAIDMIQASEENYPFSKKYSGFGPNSNTYLQWVLNKFPEFKIKLSDRFIGKDFNV